MKESPNELPCIDIHEHNNQILDYLRSVTIKTSDLFEVTPNGFQVTFPLDKDGCGLYGMEFKCSKDVKNTLKEVLKAENVN